MMYQCQLNLNNNFYSCPYFDYCGILLVWGEGVVLMGIDGLCVLYRHVDITASDPGILIIISLIH